MNEKIIKLKIDDYDDRRELCKILACAGYKVSIVETEKLVGKDYYVEIYIKESDHD